MSRRRPRRRRRRRQTEDEELRRQLIYQAKLAVNVRWMPPAHSERRGRSALGGGVPPSARLRETMAGLATVAQEASPPEASLAAAASSGNRPTRRAAATQGRSVQRSDSRNLDRSIVGKRVRVYWEDDQVWYSGVVKDYNRLTELHMVQFDDGDQREEPLNFPDEVTWELERAETPGAGRRRRQRRQPPSAGAGARGRRRRVHC